MKKNSTMQRMHLTMMTSVAVFTALCGSANATSLIVNGGFETTTNGPGEFDYSTIATGWTSSGYNFIFASGTADTTGSSGQYGNVTLWGPNNGSINGLPATSPDGGNFVAGDGAFQVGAIQQMINGLIPGDTYEVGFWWAGAQQSNRTGATTEQWQVSLGSQTQSTPVVQNASHGFTGWVYQVFDYTATSASETLSFLAVGTPSGVPPFALLDGVSLTDVPNTQVFITPEPATVGLVVTGLGILSWTLRRRRKARR